MKRISQLCLIVAFAAISGCAALQATNSKIQQDVQKVEAKIATDVQAASVPDLENAKLGAANLPEPQKTDALTCINEQEVYLGSVVTALTAVQTTTTTPGPAFNPLQPGIFTLAVDAQLQANTSNIDPLALLTAAIPQVPHQLVKDCLIVITDSKVAIAKLGLQAATLAASVANIGAAAKLKAGASALKAGEAALKVEAAAVHP
jgi:hypothetical protein